MPERIQMSRRRKWRRDNPDAVIVARPSKWGNPWKVVRTVRAWDVWVDHTFVGQFTGKQDAIVRTVADFGTGLGVRRVVLRDALDPTAVLAQLRLGDFPSDAEIRAELAGRDLACWCKPTDACHADVLMAIANPMEGRSA